MRGSEQEARDAALDAELKEVVLGLHWTPPEESNAESRVEEPANLDAFCVLLDGKQRVLEVVHPGRPRNAIRVSFATAGITAYYESHGTPPLLHAEVSAARR